ncbi:MAG: D-glycero-alpha-D-manno-heptose-1,7-bisphosphate 7-phosphatase [Planctomycetota bacterium]
MSRPAVFLDRDGTIIEHVHHLHRVEDVRLVEGAAEAVARLRSTGRLAVLATNQSVVGRGMLSAEGLGAIHEHLQTLLREAAGAEARLDAVYWNPHVPPADGTTPHADRKPNPGMLHRAAADLDLDLSGSWMVGDALTDLEAARRAGCRGGILVRTGEGAGIDEALVPEGAFVAADLTGAVELLLDREESIAAGGVDSRAGASDD